MRTAAGIILIILGSFSFMIPTSVIDAIAWDRATSYWDYFDIQYAMSMDWLIPAYFLLIALFVGAGICTLVKRYYVWAFSGAVSLILAGIILAAFSLLPNDSPLDRALAGILMGMLYAIPGLIAVISLVDRADEFR